MSKSSKQTSATADIVLWGATSFVGQLLAAYLWPRYGATNEVRFALGGRSRSKLEAVHRDLNADDRLPLLVGDASDTKFLDTLASNAAVVVSTVGPYARYGSELVAACAANGTDYCDLSGETQWMRRMIDTQHPNAVASGARIVHACGFDSIPSDLGVLFIQDEAQQRFGHPLQQIKLRIKSMRGGVSGGTVASMLNFVEEARRDPAVAKIAKNPFALAPENMRKGVRQPNVSTLQYDSDIDSWVAPFVMAAVNTRVVHRTNALLGHRWGKEFKYDEAVMTGKGVRGAFRAAAFAGGLGAFFTGALFAPTRNLMNRAFLPKPGEGPSPEQQEKGSFKFFLLGSDSKDARLVAMVTGDRDPGYGSTSKMLGEAALCLLKDIDRENVKGGFWTPATAMGQKLIDRLIAHAGLTFEIVKK
jgi:short subunit dehydrogenase-like uncharacterized protein